MSAKAAFDVLAKFETPEAIAEFLLGLGIRGFKRQPESCPMARFLGDDCHVHVGYIWVTTSDDEDYDLTPAMASFVEDFDNDYYPELEEVNE